MFFISYGTRTGPVRDPQGCYTATLRTRKGIDTTRIGKTRAQASYLAVRGPYRPLMGTAGAVYGLFTIPKPVRGPLVYNALLKLYGPRMGRQNSHGAARGP